MAITVCGNCINFGSQTMCVDPAGIYISGRFDFAGCDLAPNHAQGSVSGYFSGGRKPSPPAGDANIQKFPFASDSPASDVAELTLARYGVVGQSSSVAGYSSGGETGLTIPTTKRSEIDKFPFASDTPASSVGNLTAARCSGSSQSSAESGYTTGGHGNPPFPSIKDIIDKFPFSSDTSATDVGELSAIKYRLGAGQSSFTSGYNTGGDGSGPTGVLDTTDIEKFPFASDSPASVVADISVGRRDASGQSSASHGYMSGGDNEGVCNTIEKFPFSTDTNATDVGDLDLARCCTTGQSSTTFGYTSGGRVPPSAPSSEELSGMTHKIDKFSFASDGNATDVGNLVSHQNSGAGQQV